MLGFACLFVSLLPIIIAEKGFFIYSGDYNAQQITFYHTVNTAVRSGQFGWHWFTDLGTDLMTSYSFYLFGSPFFLLSTILPAGAVTYALPVLLAVKHGIASLTSYAYIRRFVRSKEMSLVGALLYSFSGFQVFNIFFNHFQDVTAFFPLMLIAMEENINNRRRGVFAVTVAFMAVLNYYFFAGQAVFLVLYYLFRMRCPDFNTSWRKFFALAAEAVIGTMIAAAVLLPTAMDIMGNYRINEHLFAKDMVIYSDGTLIPRIIQSFFMPPDPPASPNLFYSENEQWASIGGYFPLFSMAGVIAFMKGRKKHWATRFSICCIIFAMIPWLNSLFQAMNGYYYARWFYMPLLIFAMMTAQALDDKDSDLMFGWKICAVMVAAFAIIGTLPEKGENGEVYFMMMPFDPEYFWLVMIITVILLAVSRIIFMRRKRGKSFKRLSVLLTAGASVICVCTTVYYLASTVKTANSYIDAVIRERDKIVCEKVSEDNFFRVDISEGDDNYPMYWELPSIRCFHSVVDPSIMQFYKSIGVQRDVASRPDLSHYTIRGLLSAKYYYREIRGNKTFSEIQEPSGTYSSDVEAIASELNFGISENNTDITEALPGFEYSHESCGFEIYENTLYIPMGFAYDTYVSQQTSDDKTEEEREKLLIRSLILSDEQIARYSDILTENSSIPTKAQYEEICREKQQMCSTSFRYDSKGFVSEITLEKPMLVFFSVPYSDGWSAEVNGREAQVEKVSNGFMAVRADAGANTITFRYRTPGLTVGLIISVTGIILLAVYLLIYGLIFRREKASVHTHYYDYSSSDEPDIAVMYAKKLSEMTDSPKDDRDKK